MELNLMILMIEMKIKIHWIIKQLGNWTINLLTIIIKIEIFNV